MNTSYARKLSQAAGSFLAAVESERVWMAFMAALIVMVLAYRIELGIIIYYPHLSQVERLQPSAVPFSGFLKTPISDFIFIGLVGFCHLGLKRWLSWRFPNLAAATLFKITEGVVVIVVLLLLAVIERTHYELLLQLDTGLTLTFLTMAPDMFGVDDFFRMLILQDILFILAPLLVFLLALVWMDGLRRIGGRFVVILLGMIFIVQWVPCPQKISREVALNPVIYLLIDATHDLLDAQFHKNNYYAEQTNLPGDFQQHSIRLVDGAFVIPDNRPPAPKREPALTTDGKPWNVLIFVLESTGSDYIFDTSAGNQMPMPFLWKIKREGLYFSNHQAAANNSAQSAFSIFTGLYPPPGQKIFPMEQSVVIPTLNRYFPKEYDYFLIHPTAPAYWFPQFLFLNNGLHEFDNMETLPPGRRPAPTDMARNEIDSFDFLQARLDRAQEPFLGVYWSFIPHWPYSDYGPQFRILPGDAKKQAYYNNLRALDTQLQRIYDHLAQTGMADRTVFVFVGDHGEAFEEHPGVWGHSFGSFGEMYRVPVLFWQPKLVQPQAIKFLTSHVDIIPTLLDLLGFPYDQSKFQGESVLRGVPPRKYIFSMDAYADYISAISRKMTKVTVCFNRDAVTAYDLAKDPGEKLPLNEERFPEQVEAIIKFRNYQSRMIDSYNQSLRLGYLFPPKHYFESSTNAPAH
ncbi:MAG: sulfatase-like hydrolase/transferase [Verrucomicrobiia bacterium]